MGVYNSRVGRPKSAGVLYCRLNGTRKPRVHAVTRARNLARDHGDFYPAEVPQLSWRVFNDRKTLRSGSASKKPAGIA